MLNSRQVLVLILLHNLACQGSNHLQIAASS